MTDVGTLYFHSPCFDGIISAVIAGDFLERHLGWGQLSLQPVNYHLREEWLTRPLRRPCAVVDFLYHPDTDFWADHHETSILTEQARRDLQHRQPRDRFVYDSSAGSCAGLLWKHLDDAFEWRTNGFAELVTWAEKIDAARYQSVSEAIEAASPALQISSSLAMGGSGGYCEQLVRWLREDSLESVAAIPDVRRRSEEVRAQTEAGLKRLEPTLRMEEGEIVVFDVDAEGTLVNRYSPYYFYPHARYSAGITRTGDRVKIAVMRNPWLEFTSVNLGEICRLHGGGGHQRVGAVLIKDDQQAEAGDVLQDIVQRIQSGNSHDQVP